MAESSFPAGYAGKFLRVDLSKGSLTEERWGADSLRKWVGGTGVGVKLLYDEVGPDVAWDGPSRTASSCRAVLWAVPRLWGRGRCPL